MKKLKAFFYIYKNSLKEPAYYNDVLKVKNSFSFKYFLALAFFATLIVTLRTALPLMPDVKRDVNNVLNEFSQLYPNDLMIEAKDGEWSINKPEPFVFVAPKDWAPKDISFPKSLLVFDHEGTINSMKEADTLILVNKANILIKEGEDKINVYPLQGLPDGQYTIDNFNEFLAALRKLGNFAPYLVFVFVLFSSAFYYFTYRLLTLSLAAVALFISGKINKFPYSFGQYFRISLHAITLPLTIEVLINLIGTTSFIPLWFFVLNLLFGLYVLMKIGKPQVLEKKEIQQ